MSLATSSAADAFGVPLSMQWPCLANLNGTVRQSSHVANDGYHSQLGEDKLIFEHFFSSPAWNCRSQPTSWLGTRFATEPTSQHCSPHPPAYLDFAPPSGILQREAKFFKTRKSEKKTSFSLQTYAPSRKFRSLFRKKKASFSLQTGAPSEKKGPNGRRRRAKVGNR